MKPTKSLYRVSLNGGHEFTVVALTFEEALKKGQEYTKDVPVEKKSIVAVALVAVIDVE